MNINELNNSEENVKYKYCVSVKFNGSKKAYNFGTDDETFRYGDKVVVETVRGLELGELISDVRDAETHQIGVALKPVLRKATAEDVRQHEENIGEEPSLLKRCQECINQLALEMYLISAEYTLDRTKVIFSYVADERVDFRELLKLLAAEFKCRIELRQIGPRDKAKIIGGLGSCGMETCCSRFLDDFDIVSINMAKNQLLALNTSKLSGQCGKLMCCLKYEDEAYKKLRVGLPKLNALVIYNNEKFRITSMNLLNNSARISNKENAVDLTIDELKVILASNRKEKEKRTSNED
ncbi:MAG TPA: regulatory iron-sulfur-containing complex subunit RicT [Erysipelotrichaceae bacterium]|nr:regulatory iron-sulfur-containing complex subunit RicT [Erysipelotrichaceae bacterium]HQB31799.1 regulatory iron-sulfur-containing complex subunit RicT [Erysipelotrichaceae bacterium]